MVEFIYTGQCKVEQKDLENFLSMIKELKVEGLTGSVIYTVKQ